MLLAYNTNGFANHDPAEAIALLAEIGYRGVGLTLDHGLLNPFSDGLPAEISRFRRLLERHQMRSVVETGARFLLDPSLKHEPTLMTGDPAARERRIAFYRRAIDIAWALKSDCVSIWSGVLRGPLDDDAAFDTLIHGLWQVCDYAAEKQVTIAFEPEPGMFIDRMDRFEQLLARFEAPPLRLTLDIGHLHCQNETPIADYIRRWGNRLANVHIEDMRRGVHEHLMFGEGEIDFRTVLDEFKTIDYKGLVQVELSRHSHVAPEAARRAWDFLQPLIRDRPPTDRFFRHPMTLQFSTNLPNDPLALVRPKRRITGMSAILLPFAGGEIDWPSFAAHVQRTADAGLVPAVNMDTGYVNLLGDDQRLEVLERTRDVLAGRPFVAGAFVGDAAGSRFDLEAYLRQIEPVVNHGGTPVIFQSYGLISQADDEIIAGYRRIAERVDRFIGFELGTMFAPFGKIYSLDVYRGLLGIRQCVGAKHSSLRRDLEWQRLALRDSMRPEFLVLTGNDLAIDMVIYGSDYLLGLSTMAPDFFARRDACWAAGDPEFYELNDVLQYLGFFAFRPPVPAYKHTAAMFLQLRGWLKSDETHPRCPTRPASDREILIEIATQLSECARVSAS